MVGGGGDDRTRLVAWNGDGEYRAWNPSCSAPVSINTLPADHLNYSLTADLMRLRLPFLPSGHVDEGMEGLIARIGRKWSGTNLLCSTVNTSHIIRRMSQCPI